MRTEAIKQAYAHWKKAVINRDLSSLDKICTDNFSWTNAMGVTLNKTENLRKIGSGDLQYISWVNEDMQVKMAEDLAIIKTRETLHVLAFNHKIKTVQNVTAVFINQNGNWLLASGQEMSTTL